MSSLLSCLIEALRQQGGSQGSALSRKAVWLAGLTALALVLLVLPAVASAAVCTDTWKGPAEGLWGTAGSWSAEHVPTSSDVACIESGSTVEVASGVNQVGVVQGEGSLVIHESTLEVTNTLEASSINTLAMHFGGVLTGAAAVDVSGSLVWSGSSTMSGSGLTVLGSGATASVATSAVLLQRTLVNEGTFTFVEGSLRMDEGAQLDNSGTFKANGEGVFGITTGGEGAAPLVVNTGLFEKTVGEGKTQVEVSFENSGTVKTPTGRLVFGEKPISVTLTSSGVLEGTEVFNHATITAGGFKAPSGKVTVEYGSLTISEGSTVSIANFTMNFEAMVTGAGTLDLTEAFVWNLESTMSGSGTTIIKPGATGSFQASTMRLKERTLVNEGTITLEAYMQLAKNARVKNPGTFNANIEGVFGITTEEEIPTGVFINTGVFQKTKGTGETRVEVNFENEGKVEAQTGKLTFGYKPIAVTLASGSTLTGEILINAGAIVGNNFKAVNLVIEHASLTIPIGSTATITDFTMRFESVLTGGGTLNVSETFEWGLESTMAGTGTTTIKPGATALLDATTMYMTERTLVNEGTAIWKEGSIAMGNNANLDNFATFDANSEHINGMYVRESESTDPAPQLNNDGKFQKIEGTGQTTVQVPFFNSGSIVQATGKLLIKDPVSSESSSQWGGENPSEGPKNLCGEPVDCATGDFFETETDLSVGGRGVGLNMIRTYNSQAAVAGVSGAFGPGWSSSFSDHLVVAQGKAMLHQANGSTVPFIEGKGTSFSPPAWSQDTLNGSTGVGYSLVLPDQRKYQFEGSTGRLQSVVDRNGNQTKLAYNKAGQLETITDPAGRKITLAYNGEGLIETAKDPMGHTVKYTYEGGQLATVTEPGEAKARWTYHYDGSHQMTSFTDGRGGKTSNEYDGSHRVTSQTDPSERTLTFEYEPFHTKITNHSTGSVTDEHYTSSNEPYSITRGFGTASATTSTFTYDAANDLTSVTDGNSHTTTYTYENGNKTSMVDPNKNETKWTYDGTHDVLSVTTPKGETTTITRDSHGNAETVSRPAPHSTTQTTTYHYDANGNLTSAVDPLKHTWSYEYDTKGNRTSETDPEGDKRTFGFNEDSQETSSVSPKGNVKGAEASQYTTKIERDEQGRPKTITDPLGHTVKYAYDGNSNIETVTDADGHTTTNTYDADNRKTKVKEPSGITTETAYNGAGNVTSQTDGNKHTTTYTRNPLGEITEIKDPLARVTKKEYDAAGNLLAVVDPAKRTTKYSYDPANRLKEITYSESKTPTVKYEYDADGNRVKMTDGTGKTTYTYDQLDRLVQSTDGHGDNTGYEYDLAGNQTKLTYPNGTLITRAYDNAARLQSVTDPSKNTTTFAYDPNSNLTATTFPKATGEQDKITYNNADQQIKITMSGNGVKLLAGLAYTRDNEGQIKTTTSNGLPGSASTNSTYDTNNRLEKAGSTAYAYDSADSPTTLGANTSAYDAAGELKTSGSNTYGYDQLGNRVSTTPKGGQATIYAYDQAGNLTQAKQNKAGGLNVTYTSDGNGLRATQTKGKTTTALTWDTHGELPLIISDEQNTYIYGPNETPIEEIQSKGAILYLHHDQQNSTRMITSATGNIEATTSYDPYGNTTGTTGTTTTPLGYDAQYTNTDTGLIYQRARSYDPTTAQFTSTDPVNPITRQPFNYTNDNPLNMADPAGLCSINPFSSSSCVSEAAEAGVHFAEQHPVATGVALGVVAVGTGGAAVVVEGAAGTALGITSVAAGTGAAALDGSKCLNGDSGACVGAGLGAGSVLLAAPELLSANGLIAETSLFRGLAGAGLGLGAYATLADLLTGAPGFLTPLFGC